MQFNETTAEARKLWIDELRSGKWQQGKRRLACNDQYCCLGVATELFTQLYPNVLEIEVSVDGKKSYSGDTHVLPKIVQDWLGLRSDVGNLKDKTVFCTVYSVNDVQALSLSMVNDWAGYTFEQIAQLIENGNVALKDKE